MGSTPEVGSSRKQNGRFVQDGATERQALFPAAGEQARETGAALLDAGHPQDVIFAFGSPRLGDAVDAAEKIDVLFDARDRRREKIFCDM